MHGVRVILGFSAAAALAAVCAGCGSDGDGSNGGGGGSSTASVTGAGGAGGAPTGSGGATSSTGAGGASTATTGAGGAGGGAASSHWLMGYYVGYQRDLYPPSAIDFDSLTHLAVGRVVPKADGSLDTTYDVDAVSGPAMAKELVSLAHQHGKKAIAMLGGAGEHAGWVGAASDANRAQFVQNLVALAADVGYDGFDLDWEPLDPADMPDFQALAEALRQASPNAVLTVPLGWVNANFADVDPFYATVAPLFDQMNLMTYGMAATWDGWESWHSSALFGETASTPSSIDSSVKAYLAAGVPAAKLGIGVGFYGGCWSAPVTGPHQPPNGAALVADDNVMSYANIMESYYDAQHDAWDADAHVPYLSFPSAHGPEGCTFVSYENAQSMKDKADYVVSQGLGGAIVWTINEGYLASSHENPLLSALGGVLAH